MVRRANLDLHDVRLIAIVETQGRDLQALIDRARSLAQLARPGAIMFQLRDKLGTAQSRMQLGRTLRDLSSTADQRFFVNDRVDMALLLDADGVHLGGDALTAEEARRVLAGRALGITVAHHHPLDATPQGVDGVLLSPICSARKGRFAIGIAELAKARAALPPAMALFALGGVTAANARSCLESGATGVAAIGAVWDAPELESLVTALGIARA